jgi:hypothetical protein
MSIPVRFALQLAQLSKSHTQQASTPHRNSLLEPKKASKKTTTIQAKITS